MHKLNKKMKDLFKKIQIFKKTLPQNQKILNKNIKK